MLLKDWFKQLVLHLPHHSCNSELPPAQIIRLRDFELSETTHQFGTCAPDRIHQTRSLRLCHCPSLKCTD